MIYFVQDEATCHIKIGYHHGGNMPARLQALQTGCPSRLVFLGYMSGTMADEGKIHQTFASDRVQGEWFRPTPRILRFIIGNMEDSLFSRDEILGASF